MSKRQTIIFYAFVVTVISLCITSLFVSEETMNKIVPPFPDWLVTLLYWVGIGALVIFLCIILGVYKIIRKLINGK